MISSQKQHDSHIKQFTLIELVPQTQEHPSNNNR